MVDVDVSKLDDKAERINITLPRRLLSRIDRHTQARHESRSGFLARAAVHELAREPGLGSS